MTDWTNFMRVRQAKGAAFYSNIFVFTWKTTCERFSSSRSRGSNSCSFLPFSLKRGCLPGKISSSVVSLYGSPDTGSSSGTVFWSIAEKWESSEPPYCYGDLSMQTDLSSGCDVFARSFPRLYCDSGHHIDNYIL